MSYTYRPARSLGTGGAERAGSGADEGGPCRRTEKRDDERARVFARVPHGVRQGQATASSEERATRLMQWLAGVGRSKRGSSLFHSGHLPDRLVSLFPVSRNRRRVGQPIGPREVSGTGGTQPGREPERSRQVRARRRTASEATTGPGVFAGVPGSAPPKARGRAGKVERSGTATRLLARSAIAPALSYGSPTGQAGAWVYTRANATCTESYLRNPKRYAAA